MIPHLKHWKEQESGTPMLPSGDMDKLTGAQEYCCDVQGPKLYCSRFLCRVVLGYDALDAWCDTTTGTLYGMDGRCMSSTLRLVATPVLTGRAVPSKAVRDREGERRALP